MKFDPIEMTGTDADAVARADLNRLQVFVAVVRAGSFTAAAQRLGVPKARASQQLSRLEAELGTNLLVRTTRRLSLTDAGRDLYHSCEPLLRELHAATSAARTAGAVLGGTLRITTSADHAAQFAVRAAAEFGRQHPALSIELRASDDMVDLVAEGLDLAIRAGRLQPSTLRARRLLSFQPVVMASPDYLRRHGIPKQPEDLRDVDWVGMMRWASPYTLRLRSGQRHATVRLRSRFRVDANASLRAALEAGAGVGVLDPLSSSDGVARGTLVRLLPDWSLPRADLHAVYPDGQSVAPATRAFIDFYAAFLARAWPQVDRAVAAA